MARPGEPKLRKDLSFFYVLLSGIGVILGAGIYAVIGKGAAVAGNSLWLSFVIGAVIASFTGLSYAELSSAFSRDAAEYNYAKQAFRRKGLAFLAGLSIILAGLMSSSTVALGFAGYLYQLAGLPVMLGAAALIIILSLINFFGIRNSARFNAVGSLVEFSGLFIIILLGIGYIGRPGIDYLQSPAGFAGTMSAVTLVFFAFIGFEDIVNLSEETRNSRKVMPLVLIVSLAVCTLLYVLVALTAVSVLSPQQLADSHAPLADVAAARLGPVAFPLLALIALFATGNTALLMLIATSRVVYAIARDGSLPRALSRVHPKRRTPHVSIALLAILGLAAVLLNNLKSAAELTDVSIFVAYLMVNLSVIKLRFSRPGLKRGFRIPLSIGRLPVLPTLGALSCLAMLSFFDTATLLLEAALLAAGYVAYTVVTR